jgi:hypothetical protein
MAQVLSVQCWRNFALYSLFHTNQTAQRGDFAKLKSTSRGVLQPYMRNERIVGILLRIRYHCMTGTSANADFPVFADCLDVIIVDLVLQMAIRSCCGGGGGSGVTLYNTVVDICIKLSRTD